MKTDDFSNYTDYFLVGIGGAGMSAIALVLKGMGHKVRGSDIKDSRYTDMLQKEGLEVIIGHRKENIGGADAVIYSTAIPEDNRELTEARRRSIPVYSRSSLLVSALQ